MSKTDSLRARIKSLEAAINRTFAVTGDPIRNCRTCAHQMAIYYSSLDGKAEDRFCRLTDRSLGNAAGINGYSCGCWEEGEE